MAVAFKALSGVAALLAASVLPLVAVDSRGFTLVAGVLALLTVVSAGLFTIRSKVAEIWRQTAEGYKERAEELEAVLLEAKEERAAFELAQQEVRHELKNELAAARAELLVAQARTNLTDLMKHLDAEHVKMVATLTDLQTAAVADVGAAIEKLATDVASSQAQLRDGQGRTETVLKEIRDALRDPPAPRPRAGL